MSGCGAEYATGDIILVATQSQQWNFPMMPDMRHPCPVAARKSVAFSLRPVATTVESSHAIASNRSSRPIAGPLCRTRNPYDPAAPRHSQRDGNGEQASGCEPDSPQGAEDRCQR